MKRIKTMNDDLFANVDEGHIIHGCNAKGVMGSGFAAQIKRIYPVAYSVYRRIYEKRGLDLGENIVVKVEPNLVIHNAITQESYGRDGKRYVDYLALKDCFTRMCCDINEGIIESRDIHFPLIGCGLGGGDKNVILTDIDNILDYFGMEGTLWVL